jgi:gliding motility-associated-like protein
MLHFLRYFLSALAVFFVFGTYAQSSNPVGNAFSSGNNCYTITPPIEWQNGAVWFNDPLDLDQDFDITLNVFLGANDGGADGVAFVFQQVGTAAIGLPGSGMGFAGFAPSLGIELDTYDNPQESDLPQDHMAIFRDGVINHATPQNLAGPVTISPTGANVEDNQEHIFQVKWNVANAELQVFFDCELRLTLNENIVQTIFGGNSTVWWGFTGATGGLFNLQSVCISEYAVGLQENYAVCEGESLQLGVVGAPNGTYSWSPTTFLDNPAIANPTCTPTTPINYSVTFTDVCGNATTLETAVSLPLPSVSIAPLTEACDGDVVTLVATGNADVFTWSNGDEGNSASFTESGEVSVVASISGCEAEAMGEIVIYPTPVSSLPANVTFCANESVVVDATASDAVSYVWDDNSTETSLIIDASGTYDVTITSAFGCETVVSISATAQPFPVINLPESTSLCDGESIVLNAGNADNYLWSTGATTSSILVDQGGVYSVSVDIAGCTADDEAEVFINPLPQFTVPSAFDICPDSTVWLLLPVQPYDWRWDGASVTDSLILTSGVHELEGADPATNCISSAIVEVSELPRAEIEMASEAILCEGGKLDIPAFSFYDVVWNTGFEGETLTIDVPGIYMASVSTICGSAMAEIFVGEGKCDCPVFVPNSFSPNLDGVNELFKPEFDCEPIDYLFTIYNRWGELVFRTNDYNVGWNGAAPGKEYYVADGVYIWQLQMESTLVSGPDVVDINGFVVILR